VTVRREAPFKVKFKTLAATISRGRIALLCTLLPAVFVYWENDFEWLEWPMKVEIFGRGYTQVYLMPIRAIAAVSQTYCIVKLRCLGGYSTQNAIYETRRCLRRSSLRQVARALIVGENFLQLEVEVANFTDTFYNG
jgi:hypothetical protein